MEPLKAGYVSFGTQFYEPGRLREISARAEKQLRDAGTVRQVPLALLP